MGGVSEGPAAEPLATHHAGLAVSDMDAAVAWFARHLGFRLEAEWTAGPTRLAMVGNGRAHLELFARPGAAPDADEGLEVMAHFDRRGWKHAAFAVSDLRAAVERLRDGGVAVLVEVAEAPPGYLYAFVEGPDRAALELVETPPARDG